MTDVLYRNVELAVQHDAVDDAIIEVVEETTVEASNGEVTDALADVLESSVHLRPPSWHAAAMCKGKTSIFFATPGERDGRRNRREALARAYCACCPVAEQCAEAGRAGREHGLWGGENDEQRAAAGYGPRSPHRRAVAAAARQARIAAESDVA